ncbi:MAG: DNA repair protein RecN [Pseudomonadota bacterium]
MLQALEIRNIVLIEALDLEFGAGLNVLTGETGAGKSILLDALGFALGRRVRRDLVLAGAAQGSVTAEFAVGPEHPALAVLDALDLARDAEAPGRLVLRRVARAEGPASAFLNDQRLSAETLRRVGACLVEVHGQHDDRGLLDPRAHRGLLDAFGGLTGDVAALGGLWRAAEGARKRREEAEAALARAAEDADFLRHAVAELERMAPEAGEEERLDAERRLMQAAGRIAEEVARAGEGLGGGGAEGAMADALSRLTRAAERAGDEAAALLDAPIAALDRAMIELGEAQAGVEAALEALSFSPERLETVEERLFALRALARKHDVHPADLPDLALRLAERLAAIDEGGERIAALAAEADAASAAYGEAAEALGLARRGAAGALDAAVTAELPPLRMEAARFETDIAEADAGPEGADAVRFTAAINPGNPAGPIDRIASGGELSRFLLALKVCLAARSDGLVMVFDEIDRGVGGATADAVGRRLARLAEGAQALVVTHSPQVAAQGTRHFRIAKGVEAGITRTRVEALDADARLEELARMLAGEEVTAEALNAAAALLARQAA